MLAGLIFATEDAEDRAGVLAATLPFGGMTLIEYQARLLVGAGAGQILVAVTRVTPALLGAVSRAARQGVPVDVVRSAEEAAAKMHPLAHVLVLADGLVTTDPVIDRLAGEGAEALLVTKDGNSAAAVERLDAQDCWAGLARVPAARLAEIARMPADWDFQSALLRVAVQAGAEHIALNGGAARSGHAIERSADRLASRSNAVLAALTERRTSWADRWVFTRVARFVLPELVRRAVPGWALSLGGAVLGAAGLAGIAFGYVSAGLIATLPATVLFVCAAAMAALRGEEKRAVLIESLASVQAALAILLAGITESGLRASTTPVVLAVVVVAVQALVERVPALNRRWWSSPAAFPLLLIPFALANLTHFGLGAAAVYAFVTLFVAVEASREKA